MGKYVKTYLTLCSNKESSRKLKTMVSLEEIKKPVTLLYKGYPSLVMSH